jgi:RHS repeat-associated protein
MIEEAIFFSNLSRTSSFTYDANSLIDSLTTPYGTTKFSYTAPGTESPPRFVQITDPLGNKEREEWLEPAPIPASDPAATVPVGMPLPLTNAYLTYRNSFHWDKTAYIAASCTDTGGCDYTKARIRHFVHVPGTSIKGTALESQKYPLENRVWYTYPGQSGSSGTLYGGTYDRPTAIGRVLDDGSSQISTFDYDSNGNITRATDPYGRTTYYAYTNGIDIAAVSQASEFGTRSTLAQYIYSKQHRPIYYSDAAGRATTYGYNSAGQITTLTNALGEQTTYQYDTNSNPASTVDANGVTAATYTYDGFARVRTYTDSEGWTVTFDYDPADRLTRITYPDGTSARYTYQRLELVAYKDREGRSWQYQYDANRRLTAIIDPLRQTTRLGYDPAGNLTSLTDPKGNLTSFGYDVQDRQTSKKYADNSTVTYTYETTTSRLKSALDALGQTKQYSYAIDDNLIGLTYLNAVNPTPNVSFTYDPYYSRLLAMTDGVGVTSYSYNPSFVDGARQLAQECFAATGATGCSHTISYGYDVLGRSASRQISGSGPETFQYDAIGRTTNHSSDLGAFQLNYLGETQQLTVRQLLPAASSLKTTWSYLDNAHDRRLSGIANTGLTAGQFTNFSFETTAENLISGVTQESDVTVAEPSPPALNVSFNNLNEITQVSSQSYTYDANGNLLSDGQRSFKWDAENRIIEISYLNPPGKRTQFVYDGLGRRREIDRLPAAGASTISLKYIWCGARLCQTRDQSYAVQRSYFAEGEYKADAESGIFYGLDQVGSVRRAFESSSSAPSYDNDPWGVDMTDSGRLTDFGFAQLFEGDDILLANYRAYDPRLGRWLSRDPYGEFTDSSLNLFSYAANAPSSFSDPLGLWTFQVGVSYNWSAAGGSGIGFGGIAFDSNGGAAWYWGAGVGLGGGAGGSAGVQAAFSNANCVDDLKGVFGNFSRGGGWGENVTGDAFFGHDSNGNRIGGGGLSYGIGAGQTSFVGYTDTAIQHVR